VSDSDRVIFEDNTVEGGDLMSSGGVLSSTTAGACLENIWFSENCFRLLQGWDRDAIGTKGAAMAYLGPGQNASGTNLSLTGQPNWTQRANWRGAGVFILSGRGAGQYRRVVSYAGQVVQIDRPWEVLPDSGSTVLISTVQRHYLVVDNEFTDTGAVQLQAGSVECIVDGNTGVRMKGFTGAGIWDGSGCGPAWYCQFIDNRVIEGNYYHGNGAENSALTVISVSQPPYNGPLAYGTILRGNQLENNAFIRVVGDCRDVLVEGNSISNARIGISLDESATNLLVNANTFTNVATPIRR